MAQGNQQLATREQSLSTIRDLFRRTEDQIALALPKHMTAERMIRVALTAVQQSPKLLNCTPLSVIGSVVQASQLGLEPDGVLGHAYLVPFWNSQTKHLECQLIPGYRGYIELICRGEKTENVDAHVVYSNDFFEHEYGSERKLRHKPLLEGDRGTPIAAYAIAYLREGGWKAEVMSHMEVESIRERSKKKEDGPWETDWDEMAKKTVIRRLAKTMPMSVEAQRMAAADEMTDRGVSPRADLAVESTSALEAASKNRQEELRDKYTGSALPEPEPTNADLGADDPPCGCPDGPAGKHEDGCKESPPKAKEEKKAPPKRRRSQTKEQAPATKTKQPAPEPEPLSDDEDAFGI